MELRDARPDDLPKMLEIYNRAVRTSVATFDVEEQTLEQRAVWFAEHDEKYPLIVAEVDGNFAGYCSISRFRPRAAYGRTVETSVYVEEGYQGQGVGSTLVAEIVKRASALGYHTLVAVIAGENQASVRAHEKAGFVLAGRLREVGFKFGTWQDVRYYQLLLP